MSAGGERTVSTRLFLAVAASAVFISVLTATMINVLIPLIRAQFGASAAEVGWVVTGYALAYAIGVPLYGRISDFFGVRGVFSIGLAGFAVGGVICALSPSLAVLVFGRIVQGIGGAAIPALAIVSVAKVLPAGERGAGIGLIGSSLGAAAAIGPVVGGLVGQFLGWRALFVGTLVLALVLIPFARRVMPNGGSEEERRFDLIGGVLLGLAPGLFLFGVTQGQGAGFGSISSWGSFLGAALAASLFVWRINAVQHPFVSPALLKNRPYVAAILVGFLAMLANLTALVLTPLLLIGENGLPAGAAGLALTPGAVSLAVLSPLSGRLSDRIGVRTPIVAGLTIMALSVFFISAFGAGASPIMVSIGMLGIGTGLAFANPTTANAAANTLPAQEVGAGMGIFQGLLFLGSGTGPAVIGTILAARAAVGSGAVNPLYALDAAPYSDAFLAMALAQIVALIAAFGLRGGIGANKQSERSVEGKAR